MITKEPESPVSFLPLHQGYPQVRQASHEAYVLFNLIILPNLWKHVVVLLSETAFTTSEY